MRIGIAVDEGGKALDDVIGQVRAAAEAGLAGAWLGERRGWDALTTLAVAGREVPGVELGTAVVLSYPHHPLALAAQALTVQAATGNRLTLGVGPSHQLIIEGQYGYPYDRPLRHLREFLAALVPLLRGEVVDYTGETLRAAGAVEAPGAAPPSLMVSALGPAMLRMAGELTDGTITTWAGAAAISDYVVPTITRAATGRPAPRVAAVLPVCVTGDPDGGRASITRTLGLAGQLPSYRAILDRQGAAGPADVAVIGDEPTVERQLRQLADAGVTDFMAYLFGATDEQARTLELLAALNRPATVGGT